MSYRTSRSTLSTAGPQFIPTPFIPDGVEALVGSKFNVTDNWNHLSTGSACYDTDGESILQNCISICSSETASGTRHMTKTLGDRIISHWEWNTTSASFVEVLRANFLGFSSSGIYVDVITPNSNYQVVWRRRI